MVCCAQGGCNSVAREERIEAANTEEANRELDESGNHAWLLLLKTVCKVSTSAASLDRGAETQMQKQCWVLSGFRLC